MTEPLNTIKAGDEKPCLVCDQPKEAHRKPGTTELRCPGGQIEALAKVASTFTEQEG